MQNTQQRIDDFYWKPLTVFVCLFLIGLVIVVFVRGLDGYQQFFLRILLGLSTAGIAAIIPGFLKINLRWLSNSIRAGGAIALFVLVYTQNPPAITSYETFRNLTGDWYYDVHPSGKELGFGANHYGGKSHFQIVRNQFGENLCITGTLTWKIIDTTFVTVPPFLTWQSISGSVTASDKLIYQYEGMDNGPISGFCNYSIVRDQNNNITELRGNFYRVNPPHVRGTIIMRRDKPFDERAR
ncbi:MAG: hypothetical protein HZB59_06970 [Ignavibacteriales bacterium]|nr:hypothetical protein [Ignavibacteriales bacterium]